MKNLKVAVFGLCIIIMTGCENLMRDYELDTRSDYLDNMSLLEYIDQGKNPRLTLYAEAVRYAGLENLLEGQPKTRIIPTNEAIQSLLLSAGVSNIQDLSVNVVRDIFSYLVIPGAYRSLDLDEEETVAHVTPKGDLLYLTRNVGATDKFRLSINQHGTLATPQIPVISQDYVFKDGVAHIVDLFPIYQQITTPTDPVPEDVDYSDAEQHILWINADTHVINASASHRETNYGAETLLTVANASWVRHGFMLFDLEPISFVDDLTRASLNVYYAQRNVANLDPILGIYETDPNWSEMVMTWNTMPDFGAQLSASALNFSSWNEIDITGFINRAYQGGTDKISLGLRLLPAPNNIPGTVSLRSKDYGNGDYKPYISLFGAIPSELEIDRVSTTQATHDGATTINIQNLSMKAPGSSTYTYTDNNIIYVLMEPPVNGTLTKYGLPMTKFGEYTQEELKNGAIKYVHNGMGNTDLISFKVKDYIGGVYEEPLNISIKTQ